MKDKLITLLQTIINKIRGLQMTAPIPQEEYTEYLEDVIGVVNDSDLDELPAVGANDKNKFLHTNASTGAVEWADAPNELPAVTDVDEGKVLTVNNSGVWVAANPSSGGGVLVVHNVNDTLDKTWQEIHDAILSGGAVIQLDETEADAVLRVYLGKGTYVVSTADGVSYLASSASGYPSAGGM